MVQAGPPHHQPQMPEKRDQANNPRKAFTHNKASNSQNNCRYPTKGPAALNATATEFKPRTNLNLTCESDTEVADSLPPLERCDTNPYKDESHPSRPKPIPRPSPRPNSDRHSLEAAFRTATAAYQQDIRRTSPFFVSGGHQNEARIPYQEPPLVIKQEAYPYPASLPFPLPCPRMERAWQAGKDSIAEAIRASYRASCDAKAKAMGTRVR